ncbi:MAG TPA: hypothetical protein VLZ07_05375, partial [Syntrophales bacterium]|nr:hypothetical protein [Syntrophales bacterium]
MDAISKHLVGVLREGSKENIPDARTEDMLVDGRLLKPSDRIYDLTERVDDNGGLENKKDREIIVIDGRVYERVSRPGDEPGEIVDAIDRASGGTLADPVLSEEMIKKISEIAEKTAREI